jgi:IclR family transcriptional regulator, mhp operon transcriptional activator
LGVDMPSYKPVTAALRVLDVLAAANRLGERASVGEIHRLTGIDKGTIVRMLETLIHAGYLVKIAGQPNYQVTGKALSLSTAYNRHSAVGTIIAPLMSDFRQRIGWPSDVAIFDTDAMLVVKTSREGESFTLNRAPGFRAPVLGASLGLAYIAFCPEAERKAFFTRIAGDPAPWNKILNEPERLERRLADVRSRGYATMDENYSRIEYDSRISSIGVPIMTARRVFAAINVVYLNAALTPAAARDALLAPLQSVASMMAQELEAKDGSPLR